MDNSAKNINIRVCILNWNGGETLHRCIDSLLQNTDQDFSITIIDNGSTDGSLDNVKELSHYTSQAGLVRLQEALSTGQTFDISTFTVAERPFFRQTSTLLVTIMGNVKAGFRSDVKSVATDTGRRACNMYRLEYPGKDTSNICYELETCAAGVKTSLWNEYIAEPLEIIDVKDTTLG